MANTTQINYLFCATNALTNRLKTDLPRLSAVPGKQVRQTVNSAMVQSYWQIGRLIVEDEQQGASRAAYGKQQLQQLSPQLTARLGYY